MMRRGIFIAFLVAALGMAVWACAGSLACPIHDGLSGYFTGNTKTIEGHLFYEYHCPRGHDFWSRCN
jgi:hypothetical protein